MKDLTFKAGLKYPFNRPKAMLNALWILIPIVGWFAFGGYTIRIVQQFIKGNFKEAPVFNFADGLELGFFMFLKSIPFVIVYSIIIIPISILTIWVEVPIRIFLELFILPILFINFFNKETVASLFEFKIIKSVFNNFVDYIMVLLKSIALGIIFLVMIIVLVGLPAGTFTKNIFLADFYRRNIK